MEVMLILEKCKCKPLSVEECRGGNPTVPIRLNNTERCLYIPPPPPTPN